MWGRPAAFALSGIKHQDIFHFRQRPPPYVSVSVFGEEFACHPRRCRHTMRALSLSSPARRGVRWGLLVLPIVTPVLRHYELFIVIAHLSNVVIWHIHVRRCCAGYQPVKGRLPPPLPGLNIHRVLNHAWSVWLRWHDDTTDILPRDEQAQFATVRHMFAEQNDILSRHRCREDWRHAALEPLGYHCFHMPDECCPSRHEET